MRDRSVLVLGGSSWIGYEMLLNASEADGMQLRAVKYESDVVLPSVATAYTLSRGGDALPIIIEARPDIMVNLLRGEEESDYEFHARLVEYCARQGCYYVYASSAWALDSQLGQEHLESDPPNGVSPYGVFKARCENLMSETLVDFLVLRFCSVQGWLPFKHTRNESFLYKLAAGQSVTVDRGVTQNRLFAPELARMIWALIGLRARGVFHLGTADSSSEVDFLRAEARLFGYDPTMVVEGRERNINLVVRTDRLRNLFGSRFERSEQQTLDSLYACPGLQKYKRL